MAKILINDGIHPTGIQMLVDAGHDVINDKIDQGDLMAKLPDFQVICVRSATKVRQGLIDNCPDLKIIGRGGVGLDNIDVAYAQSKDIQVYNTPAASSRSVAELSFGHMFSLSRFLYQSNRMMPEDGDNNFKGLKKAYSKGIELQGKTLGVIGFGRIGQEVAKIALSIGMKVIASDPYVEKANLQIGETSYLIYTSEFDLLLENSDFITIHIPALDKAILSIDEFAKMKDGVYLINTSRGGMINEDALLEALDSGKVAAAGLDVFENEPHPRMDLLQHPRVSLSPHIGASTFEAQEKIAIELAQQIIDYFD